MTAPSPDPARGAEVVALDRAHVFHSWSAQASLNPLAIAGGEGSYVWDYDGTRYLDFSSQLVNTNIGHQHPRSSRPSRSRRPGWPRSPRSTPTTSAGRRPPASRDSRRTA